MQLLQFKALADSTRLRLLHLLSSHEFSVNELVRILTMGQSRISRHLKILTEAGLLRYRRDRLWIFYSVPSEGTEHDFLSAIAPYIQSTDEMKRDEKEALAVLEERYERSREFFDSIAENWDDVNQEILGDFNLPEAICQEMPPKCATAADLGCGTGTVLAMMAGLCEQSIGIDNSHRMLEICSRRFKTADTGKKQVSLRIGDLSHLPVRDQELDFACINLVLHHISDPEAVLHEIRRALKSGGTLVLSDFLQHSDETMRIRYGDLRLGFSPEELETWLARAGFRIEKKQAHPVHRDLTLLLISATACSKPSKHPPGTRNSHGKRTGFTPPV